MPDTSNSARDTTPRQRGRYMMEESNETKDDIIAEMKRRKEMLEDAVFAAPLCYSTETMQAQSEILDEFIERFEAALKREFGDCSKLREAISTLRTALKEIRDDVLDMVMNYKSEDPDSYAHGLCLSIGGACDMALNSTKEFDNANK